MASPAHWHAAREEQEEHLDVADALGAERRYKHISKLGDSQKLRHNSWVLDSARARESHCLVLDGVNLFTSRTLSEGGIPVCRIHVPNKADYDAICAASHASHGNVYRCNVLQWVQALTSLAPRVAAASNPPSCHCACNNIKTIWLDYTCRWGDHVVRALKLLLSPLVMGAGASDMFLTLNADTRCPHALRADGAQRFIADAVVRAGGTVEFPLDRCEEYGNGMFILQAVVTWRCCDGGRSAAAALYERLRDEAHVLRKKENSLKAKGT
jgi:hypothetical protein